MLVQGASILSSLWNIDIATIHLWGIYTCSMQRNSSPQLKNPSCFLVFVMRHRRQLCRSKRWWFQTKWIMLAKRNASSNLCKAEWGLEQKITKIISTKIYMGSLMWPEVPCSFDSIYLYHYKIFNVDGKYLSSFCRVHCSEIALSFRKIVLEYFCNKLFWHSINALEFFCELRYLACNQYQ